MTNVCPMGESRGGGRHWVRHPWKITSCYMFTQKYWYGPPTREAIGPFGSNCISREVRMALCENTLMFKKAFRTPQEISGISGKFRIFQDPPTYPASIRVSRVTIGPMTFCWRTERHDRQASSFIAYTSWIKLSVS